jgi:RNA polymerase primary sigma factor
MSGSLPAGVASLIAGAKERGYVTFHELNGALGSEKLSSRRIEEILGTISALGIRIVEETDARVEPVSRGFKAKLVT